MYGYDEYMDAETMLEEAELDCRQAMLSMDTQISMANLNGKSAAIRAVMEGAEDADDVVDAYFEASDKTANAEKKVGLIRRAIDKVKELIDKIRNFIKEKFQRAKEDSVPDDKPCFIKAAWLKAVDLMKTALTKLKAFVAKHRTAVFATAGAAILVTIGAIIAKATGHLGKKSATKQEKAGKVKGILKFLHKSTDEVDKATDAMENISEAKSGNDGDAKKLNTAQKGVKEAGKIAQLQSTLAQKFGNALMSGKRLAKRATAGTRTNHELKKLAKESNSPEKKRSRQKQRAIDAIERDRALRDPNYISAEYEGYDEYDEYDSYEEEFDLDYYEDDLDLDLFSEDADDYEDDLDAMFAEDFDDELDEFDEFDEDFDDYDYDYLDEYDEDAELDAATALNAVLDM